MNPRPIKECIIRQTNIIKKNKEFGGYILENGNVLVMPDYDNNIETTNMAHGYKLKGNKLSKGKESFSVLGQIHTHQSKGYNPEPSFYLGDGYGDLGFSEAHNSLPVFTMGWNGTVYGIRGYTTKNGMAGKVINMRRNEQSVSGLINGTYSLRSVIKRLPKLIKD